MSSFRGTVQASSTRGTSFRVVWRGDAFTTPQDAPGTTMLSQGWSSSSSSSPSKGCSGGGRRRQRRPFPPGPVLSQEDELAVSREDACALAAWAKREFPSVTSSSATLGQQQQQQQQQQQRATSASLAASGGGTAAFARSLGTVRTGVETSVRACVLEASEVERLWLWESVGGEPLLFPRPLGRKM